MDMLTRLLTEILNPGHVFALAIIVAALATAGLITVVSVVGGVWRQLGIDRMQAELKRQMIDRGMSAEEIALVLDPKRGRRFVGDAVQLPCASEAVVEQDGEWLHALVLEVADRQYHVHFVGTDMDSNAWVPEDRIRLPAGSPILNLAASFAGRGPSLNGAHAKKPPMDVEI
jgi:hypothetical protein